MKALAKETDRAEKEIDLFYSANEIDEMLISKMRPTRIVSFETMLFRIFSTNL